MVNANCLFRLPCIPPIKPIGRNTDESISAIATTGPETSFIAWSVASRGLNPSSM
jgi:hypothetical protein